jgi:glutaredoxin
VADPLTLYQAEWCPYSRLVRERLTELGVSFTAMQVEAEPEDRDRMRAATGTDVIPAAVLADGTVLAGEAEEIADELSRRFEAWPEAEAHRTKAREH